MKRLFALMFLLFAALNCGGGSSSSGSGDYILQPGSLTTTTNPTSIENYDIAFNGNNSDPYKMANAYAVIYRGTVNGTNYIGITVDKDGNPSTADFNMKIAYQGTDIPFGSTKTLTSGSEGFSIKIVNSVSTYSSIDAGNASINLHFSDLNTTNNTVTITGTGYGDDNIGVNGNTVIINSITAYYYNAAQ